VGIYLALAGSGDLPKDLAGEESLKITRIYTLFDLIVPLFVGPAVGSSGDPESRWYSPFVSALVAAGYLALRGNVSEHIVIADKVNICFEFSSRALPSLASP